MESFIEMTKEMPLCYICEPSITNLALFIDGFNCAASSRDIEGCYISPMGRFDKQIKQKYPTALSICWDGLLLQRADGNEADALKLFWSEWDEFLAENKTEEELNKQWQD
ncbi:MAG: hypothetical protein LBT89_02535 [Planctomycetaceae bacterium]|nr:hypothetical protein [Planctomycetaceae bacterium]